MYFFGEKHSGLNIAGNFHMARNPAKPSVYSCATLFCDSFCRVWIQKKLSRHVTKHSAHVAAETELYETEYTEYMNSKRQARN